MKDKVSILMTVYNGERLLKDSIEALRNQSYSNFELIIVNDGSTDSSADIIESFADIDKRIIFINRKTNMGRNYSLNEGLDKVKTNFLFINDADDISNHNRLAEQISYIMTLPKNCNWGIIGTASKTINVVNGTTKEYLIKYGSLKKQIIPKWRLFHSMPFIHSSVVYNVKALKLCGGFATEVTSYIDYFTLTKISNKYLLFGINKILVNRYIDGNNYFMKKNVMNRNQQNLDIIREWQKKNYKYYTLYNVINWGIKLIDNIRR